MSAPETTARPPASRIVMRLVTYVARHKGLVAWSLLAMIASAATDLAVPELVKRTVDGPIRLGEKGGLPGYALAIGAVLVLGAIVRGAQTTLAVRAGRLIGMSLRLDVFQHLQRMSLRYFDRHPVGMLTTRVTGDIEAIESFFASGVAAVFHDTLKLLLILVVVLVVNAKLALGLLAVLPILVIASRIFSKRSRRDFRRVRGESAATNAFTNEAISGLAVTRLFQREARTIERYDEHVGQLEDAHMATVRNFAFFFPTVKVLEALAVGLVVTLGAQGLLAEKMSFGELFQFWFLIDIFFQPIRRLSDNLNLLLQAVASGERVFAVLDAEAEIVDREDARSAREIKGEITLDDVHFEYLPEEPVLRGIDMSVPAGSTIAIVGPTGAGKSSILNLVSRFYDVQHGSVRIDGVDVRDYKQRELRECIALVLQDVFLFRGSVLDNIRLFDTEVSREAVERAVRSMRAERLLDRLPGGLDAPVEERGRNLSAGERQLIAFARALVRDPRILVLDEATASIDTETEAWIQEALDRLRAGRTTLVVAHRLSTIKKADQILVLQRGKVVERGDHATLLAAGGLYRRLYELQVRAESA